MINTIIDKQKVHFRWTKIKHPRYKYRLQNDYHVQLNMKILAPLSSDLYGISINGMLFITHGYCWDGASGPTIDTKSTMRASCIHDVLYQMIRENKIPITRKDQADRELQRIMLEDSKDTFFNRFRAGYYYMAVKLFGGSSCKPN